MHERIKKMRRALHLTQQEFADRLGIKRGTMANYEIGRNEPIDAVISLMCKTFNVSETWLRTGEGEMFIQRSSADELTAAVERLLTGESTEFKCRLVIALSALKDEHWLLLEEKLKEIVGVQEPPVVPGWKPMTDEEIEAELESYRQELLAEREAGARSSAFPKKNGA